MSVDPSQPQPTPETASSWAAFRHGTFTALWCATVVSNIGTWIYNAASAWLMTSLQPNPLVVSLVQVATLLPLFLFALPGGVLADIVDRRKLLLALQTAVAVIVTAFGVMVLADKVTPVILLIVTFLIGTGSALIAPAWQSIVPQLVPKGALQSAVAINSVGVNISRAIGPALAGIIITTVGIAAPFFVDAVALLGVVAALLLWKTPKQHTSRLPTERFWGAARNAFRHIGYNLHLRATLMRAIGFFVFASAYWALLPLVVREQIGGGANLYGLLLGAIGVGAVVGAFALPWMKQKLGPDRLVAIGTVGTCAATALFGMARQPSIALSASFLAGLAWISVLSTMNVSAQVALPDWVRARGLAIFVMVFNGAMTVGSVIWGQLAATAGLPVAHFAAATGLILAVPLTWRWKLQTGVGVNMAPSMHWPEPIVSHDIPFDRGPVMVMIEYRVDPRERDNFLTAIGELEYERRRDGGYDWHIFEDAADDGRFVETFLIHSWEEHLRQHERVTGADRIVQECVQRFHIVGKPPVTHLIAADTARVRE